MKVPDPAMVHVAVALRNSLQNVMEIYGDLDCGIHCQIETPTGVVLVCSGSEIADCTGFRHPGWLKTLSCFPSNSDGCVPLNLAFSFRILRAKRNIQIGRRNIKLLVGKDADSLCGS